MKEAFNNLALRLQNINTHKLVSFTALIICLGFTAAMVGMEGDYLVKKYYACVDAGLSNCQKRLDDYLFDGFRNITFKLFSDCFMVVLTLITLIIVTIFPIKTPRFVQVSLLIVLLALSLMSLASGYRSIDEEDKENNHIKSVSLANILSQITDGQAQLASGKIRIAAGEKALAGFQAQRAILVTNGQSTTNIDIQIASTASLVNSGKSAQSDGETKLALGYKARDGINKMLDAYENYRDSLLALVLINFVSIYSLGIFYLLRQPPVLNNNVKQADQQQQAIGLEEIALKNKFSSNETDGINNQ